MGTSVGRRLCPSPCRGRVELSASRHPGRGGDTCGISSPHSKHIGCAIACAPRLGKGLEVPPVFLVHVDSSWTGDSRAIEYKVVCQGDRQKQAIQ